MKVFFRNIHLYLGLAAGLFILMACLTGAILVFEEELQHRIYKERYFVKTQTKEVKSLAALQASVIDKTGKITLTGIKVYKDPSRTYEFAYTRKSGTEAGGVRETAFVNPYTGELVALYNYRDSFFYTVMQLHRYLLAGKTGKLIMGISTLIFLFILITGIVLWWPKNKTILKQRLRLKLNANWKRINNDLHIVLGFYSSILLFVFAFTALAWSFQWFNDGIYYVTGSSKKQPPPPRSQVSVRAITLDSIYQTSQSLIKDIQYISISIPKDTTGVYGVNVLSKNAPHTSAIDNYYFDQYSGQLIKRILFEEKSAGQKVRSTFKPIHVASIWGMPSKIIGCVVCLLGVTFPVTGFIMWRNRIKKPQGGMRS